MRFSDILGQQALKQSLVRNVDSGRISHAQLFTGIAGAGTLPLAVAYAQYIHCTNRHDGDSCGECPSCRQIAELAHPDLHFIYPVNKPGKKSGEVVLSADFMALWRNVYARTGGYFSAAQWSDELDLGKRLKAIITAKEADEMIRRLSFKSFQSKYKIIIIWQPEAMNDDAANKILKILEEPWDNTVFLLVSERPDRLLPTIISRTQEVSVPRLSAEELMPEIVEHGESDEQKVRNIARLACGDRIELWRLLGEGNDEIRRENFELFCSMMRLSYNDRHLELITWAEEVAQLSRERQLELLTDFARLLREAFMLHAGVSAASYLWGDEAAFCQKFAPFIGSNNIEPIIEQIEQARRQIAQNGDELIVFTHFALAVSKYIRPLK